MSVTGRGATSSVIAVGQDGKLSVENLDFDCTNGVPLFISDRENNAILEVVNSEIKTSGCYAISTNATQVESENVQITIRNSKIVANNESDSATGILFNVKGKMIIENSTITADSQALILRGGSHKIINTSLETKGSLMEDFTEQTWGVGNAVPLATLVIGNKSTSYQYPTNVELSNVQITTAKDVHYYDIYVWQNDSINKVTVSGSLMNKSYVNINKNGASFNVENAEGLREKGIYINDGTTKYDSFKNALMAVNSGDTIYLPYGEYLVRSGLDGYQYNGNKDLTIKALNHTKKPTLKFGDPQSAENEGKSDYTFDGAGTITFENVIISDYYANANYRGIVRPNGLIFKNCEIKARFTYLGQGTVLFENCLFDNGSGYNVYTGGSSTSYEFKNCTFKTYGSGAIHLYDNSATSYTVTVTGCSFESLNQSGSKYAPIAVAAQNSGSVYIVLENNTKNNKYLATNGITKADGFVSIKSDNISQVYINNECVTLSN